MSPENNQVQANRKKAPRWILLGLISLLALGAECFNRFFWNASSQQDRNILSFKIWVGTFLLATLWLVFLSGLRAKIRLITLFSIIALVLIAASLFKITGVSGDLTPILGWRFGGSSKKALSASAIPSPVAGSVTFELQPVGGEILKFSQFQGNGRNGEVKSFALETNWVVHPPKILWRRSVGPGWSGFVFEGGLAFTQEQSEENEVVACYELATGKLRWAHRYPARYFTTVAGEGPRATPALGKGMVVAHGATGVLTCLDQKSGRVVWTKNIPVENKSRVLEWGISCSPLILNDLVIVAAGGESNNSLVAFGLEDGKPAWSAGNDQAGYSSPVVMKLADREQILILNSGSIKSHSPDTGAILWTYPWISAYPSVATPVQAGTNRVLFSSGYGHGSELLEVSGENSKLKVKQVWKSRRMKSKMSNLFFYRGFFYGLDDGIFSCMDSEGEQKWKDGRYGHGQLLLMDKFIFVMGESGELVLVNPSEKELIEVGRFKIFDRKTWNPPAMSGQYLLVRNDLEAALIELPIATVRGN